MKSNVESGLRVVVLFEEDFRGHGFDDGVAAGMDDWTGLEGCSLKVARALRTLPLLWLGGISSPEFPSHQAATRGTLQCICNV